MFTYQDIVFDKTDFLFNGQFIPLTGIKKLCNADVPLTVGDSLYSLYKEIKEHTQQLSDLKNKLVKQYGKEGLLTLGSPNFKKADAEFDELLKKEVKIETPKINIMKNDFIQMSAFEQQAVKPFIQWVEPKPEKK